MILTDREIRVAIEQKQIIIDPPPDLTKSLSSTSLDLTLANEIATWNPDNPGVDQIFCPAAADFSYLNVAKQFTKSVRIDSTDGYVLKPKEFILAWTHETVRLPVVTRLAARVEGKSSLARLGMIVHLTAPVIHAGFGGPIQLEICNHGNLKIRLTPQMRICQLIFEVTFGTPEKGYHGQFLNQTM